MNSYLNLLLDAEAAKQRLRKLFQSAPECPTATTPIARATRAVRSNFAGRVMPNSAR